MPPKKLKRKGSVINLCDSPDSIKRPRTRSSEAKNIPVSPVIIDDDDEDFASILAQIKAQEESEALAARLQEEWNGASSSGHAIVNSPPSHEDDEAMARRLAAEWGADGLGPPAVKRASNSSLTTVSAPAKRLNPNDDESPPDERLAEFRDLFTADRSCTKCGTVVPSPRGFVTFTSVMPPSLLVLLHAPCKSCKTNHCRGCFKPILCPSSCKGRPVTKKSTVKCSLYTCCVESRAIAVFEILGGLDRLVLAEKATADSRALAHLEKSKGKAVGSVGPGGTGYGIDAYYGHSYGAYGPGIGRTEPSTKSTPADKMADHWDELISRALETLTTFLPSPYSESPHTYDLLPHLALPHLLSVSQLSDILGSLLRNDSVTDWINRIVAYQSMLGLLSRMADCELTVGTLIEPRWEIGKTPGLENWMWSEGEIEWESTVNGAISRGKSLLEHFEKLTKQCEAFLAGASQMMDSANGDDQEMEETVVKASTLCGDIVAAKGAIERAMAVLGAIEGSPPDDADVTSASESVATARGVRKASKKASAKQKQAQREDILARTEQQYRRACEDLSFKHVVLCDPDTGEYPHFNYHKELAQTASATRNPKYRLHLIKELAVMATSLPPGIWVRVDEVRNDAVKVMIAGPEGTPYANGLFEFDCFMPMTYPNSPPLMHLRTTGGGTVRFNPNLYNAGKVCLSLLGTWAGRPEEQWSTKSTLLQVLISIQSMILVDTPYFNEPGRGPAQPESPLSIAYNKEISLQTARWAIVSWLKDGHRKGIWADVIASHFTIRSSQIREQLLSWSKQKPSALELRYPVATSGTGVLNDAPPMDWAKLLQQYDQGMSCIETWIANREVS